MAPLKASLVFVSDLSRALSIQHGLDFIELASYGSARTPAATRGSACSKTSTASLPAGTS